MNTREAVGESLADRMHKLVQAMAGMHLDRALSVAAFGRDITRIPWNKLTPEEKRAINELAQAPSIPAWLERFAENVSRGSDAPQPTFVRSVDFGRGRGIVHIPAGYQNRKARRAAKAKRRREAWHAFKAGRREGMSEGMARSLELKALADPSWLAQQILEQEERHRRSGGDG